MISPDSSWADVDPLIPIWPMERRRNAKLKSTGAQQGLQPEHPEWSLKSQKKCVHAFPGFALLLQDPIARLEGLSSRAAHVGVMTQR